VLEGAPRIPGPDTRIADAGVIRSMPMHGARLTPPGQLLGSVALRYRQAPWGGFRASPMDCRANAWHASQWGASDPGPSSVVDGVRSVKLASLESVLFLARESMGS